MIERLKAWWRARKIPPTTPRRPVHFAAGPFAWPVCGGSTRDPRTIEFGPAVTCPACRRDGPLLLIDYQVRFR